jgi:hypothetical protein
LHGGKSEPGLGVTADNELHGRIAQIAAPIEENHRMLPHVTTLLNLPPIFSAPQSVYSCITPTGTKGGTLRASMPMVFGFEATKSPEDCDIDGGLTIAEFG